MNAVVGKKSAHCPRADRTCGNVLFPDISLQAHLGRGAAVRPGRSCGKVEGCRDAGLHRRMWQTLVAVPCRCPLAFNNSTETQNAACPPCCWVRVRGCGLVLVTPVGYHQRVEAMYFTGSH